MGDEENTSIFSGTTGTALQVIGIFFVFVILFKFLKAVINRLYISVIGPALKKNVDLKKMGRWAVVTGSTAGIGQAFAENLAKQGMDVILISRSLEKLENVAAEIESVYKVRTKVIDVDFTEGPSIYEKIEKALYGYEIGVLINNVGLSYSHPEYFLKVKDNKDLFANIINCNISSVTHMTQLVLPQMVERGRGVIVNVSSTAALIPSPMLTVYSASKAYVDKFSQDLSAEYRNHGIVVQCLLPGYVATKMSRIRKATFMAPSPAKYVSHALSCIGLEDSTTGYWPHNWLVMVVDCLKNVHPNLANRIILRTMENIRNRIISRGG